MTKRIFRSIFLVALVVLLLSVALLSVVFYNDYAVQYRSELKSEALSMAHAINGGLAEEDYLRSLEQDKISPIRITWIGADGTVRYDNEAAPAQMENHAARTEVADALRYGAGESERYSATLSQKTFYYACRLQDGTVLRLAGTRDSVLGILLRMLRPAVAAVLVAIALAWLLSYRLSKRIVRPLNALDLEHPEQAEAYDELSPLLEKISAQNRQIAAQMDELRRRQTEFTAITEHMNEGLLIVDARTNLLFCNPSARRLLQIENVEKQSVLAVNRSEDFREAVQRALSGEHDLRTLTLDGRIYQLMANPAMEDGRLAGAVLVLSLGCENNNVNEFKKVLGNYNPNRVKFLITQDVEDEVEAGMRLLDELTAYAATFKRQTVDASELVIGLKCGGSDGLSGITANPLLGSASDLLARHGGTTLLTEVPEMFGAETILMDRCKDEATFRKAVDLINNFKEYFIRHGQEVYENPSPGNKAGGITTLEDKSLGCTQKGGTAEVRDVLSYCEPVTEKGLNLVQGPGNDLCAITALMASGAQMVLFTTGRGTPVGAPIPTVKVSTNTPLSEKKRNWIDFNAGILAQGADMQETTEVFFKKLLAIASGEQTQSEKHDYREIAIFKDGVTL